MFGLPLLFLMIAVSVFSHEGGPQAGAPTLFGIPIEFILFATVLLGVALFHHQTFRVATTGLAVITLYKLFVTGFAAGPGLGGLGHHLSHEWVVIANLLCLLLGFVILARHFEKSHVPVILPKYLPDDWTGAFVMLIMVFVISSFLDNIAAALIGGAMAHQLFRGKVHIGFLAAIVAASNAGGSGSVVGDTTTTMMWIDGIAPADVFHAYVAALVALVIFGIPASIKQQNYSPIIKNAHAHTHVDWVRLGIVVLILLMAMGVNLTVNIRFPELADGFPFLGVAVWAAILISLPLRRPDWEEVGGSVKGTLFLLSLVLSASMMPVEKLPLASWETTLGLGFVSAAFDNIPLTALALKQGGYDWGMLAYAVGFGGSMLWFGSSAGVALTNMFPEGKSVWLWLREGWYVVVGYVAGFLVMLWLLGWQPHAPHKELPSAAPSMETGATATH
jgi:Na+/H+ antiporter NhaD/arsenite permease-like protein